MSSTFWDNYKWWWSFLLSWLYAINLKNFVGIFLLELVCLSIEEEYLG